MTPPPNPKTALIIGATGSFGGHAAAALIKHGWRVRALARDPAGGRRQARRPHADRVGQGRRHERRRASSPRRAARS